MTQNFLIQFFKKKQNQHFSILFFLWIVALILIQPFGNFPLYDDWCFSKTLNILYEQHKYRYIGCTTTHFLPLVPHYILGYLFCLPLGFSHIMIRISTIILSIVGVIYFYKLIKHLFNEKLAFISSIILAFNPLFFMLSYSYMTDVPFFVYTIITLFYFNKYIDTERKSALILCILFSLAATLTRQLGIVLSFAMIFVYLFNWRKSIKPIGYFIACFILNILVYLISIKLFKVVQNEYSADTGLGLVFESLRKINLVDILNRYNAIIFLISICIIPVHILTFPRLQITRNKVIIASVLLLPLVFIPNHLIGPYISNFYIGPLTTKDVYGFSVLNTLVSDRLMMLFTAIGIVSSFIFLLQIITFIEKTIKQLFEPEPNKLIRLKASIFIYISIYCSLFLVFPGVSDRYLIPIIILTIIILFDNSISETTKKQNIVLIFSLLVAIGISIVETHDYFSINTAKWEAVNYLIKDKKVKPNEFDAGYEANGWYNYSKPLIIYPNKSWWYVTDDKYIVSLSPFAGYSVIKEYKFSKWFHNYANTIYVSERRSDIETMKPQTFIDFESIHTDSSGFISSNQIVKIPSTHNISKIARSGKNALFLDNKSANDISFLINKIKSDDYCEMRFWTNTETPNIKTKLKVFSFQYDVEIEKIKTSNGWTQFKCGFFASSWISDYTDIIYLKIVPNKNAEIIIDDVRLITINKPNK